MKTKLSIAILLAAICVLFVVGSSGAQQDGYTVYLPIIANPPCTPVTRATAYVATSRPVVRVGEFVTVTGAIVNVCNPFVGHPYFDVLAEPSGVLSSTTPWHDLDTGIPSGSYTDTQFVLLAVGAGPVTLTLGVSYETINDSIYPPMYYWDSIRSSPATVHVLSGP